MLALFASDNGLFIVESKEMKKAPEIEASPLTGHNVFRLTSVDPIVVDEESGPELLAPYELYDVPLLVRDAVPRCDLTKT